jgi:hypothetical protein
MCKALGSILSTGIKRKFCHSRRPVIIDIKT